MLHVKSFAFNPFSENTYLIYNDNGDAFLIDPGNMPEQETQTLENFIKSENLIIKTKLFTLPEETDVYSGHGEKTTIGFEKNHNPFLK